MPAPPLPSSWECDDNLEVIETTSLSSPDFTKVTAAIHQEIEQEINIPNSLLTDRSQDTTRGVESENVQTNVQDIAETEVTTKDDLPSTFVETSEETSMMGSIGIKDETEETRKPTGQEQYVTESSELVTEVSASKNDDTSMDSGVSLATETQTKAQENLEDTESGIFEQEG